MSFLSSSVLHQLLLLLVCAYNVLSHKTTHSCWWWCLASFCCLMLVLLLCSPVGHSWLQSLQVSLPQGASVRNSIILARSASPAEQCPVQLHLRAGVPVVGRLPGKMIQLQPLSDSMTISLVPHPSLSHSNMVPLSGTGGQMATEPSSCLPAAAGEAGSRAMQLVCAQCSYTCNCRRHLPCSCPQSQPLRHFWASQCFHSRCTPHQKRSWQEWPLLNENYLFEDADPTRNPGPGQPAASPAALVGWWRYLSCMETIPSWARHPLILSVSAYQKSISKQPGMPLKFRQHQPLPEGSVSHSLTPVQCFLSFPARNLSLVSVFLPLPWLARLYQPPQRSGKDQEVCQLFTLQDFLWRDFWEKDLKTCPLEQWLFKDVRVKERVTDFRHMMLFPWLPYHLSSSSYIL